MGEDAFLVAKVQFFRVGEGTVQLFLKEFTVLLLTTSLGRAFQVVVILIG